MPSTSEFSILNSKFRQWNTLNYETPLKSLPTSLFQREEYWFPLYKKGRKGDFVIQSGIIKNYTHYKAFFML
ncbi:MAG: hypothetical protein A3J55_01940 [Candidatus Ryanbacteria bacterium RIFCSPHIGHO2_02_FULL_45_17b]|uniref:Uncharacterized protein n=1 Tax=Candidatus Ryanbacteria bacterium RIFCSPHIGHO2_01_FULL_45_22 TaxID=1802114 RepID=A0A1G2G2P5_9BACT|nr:MAG: hypothetical protein A2719_04125 [Candidatus Ryanbacteria bacterium RIFCSPHIGHO2_01_FULL_45_22]OGZ47661.1 MAG: hypothetical protein A3J55_01940 [Candidatus Ryanbacteria bacterium RIFCSPHIGHO2_02_FULL_45_17b]